MISRRWMAADFKAQWYPRRARNQPKRFLLLNFVELMRNTETAMGNIENELKHLIIDTLDLEDVDVDDIDNQAPLFNAGLGLDSIDALELGLAIRKNYHVKIDAEKDDVLKIFASVSALADFITEAALGKSQLERRDD